MTLRDCHVCYIKYDPIQQYLVIPINPKIERKKRNINENNISMNVSKYVFVLCVRLGTIYLTFYCKLFAESVLKYTYILNFFENMKRYRKK